MVPLSDRVSAHLDPGWRVDLVPDWRESFERVEPNLLGLPNWDVWEMAPPRLNLEHPREAGALASLRPMTRAFDSLTPERDRVVIIG